MKTFIRLSILIAAFIAVHCTSDEEKLLGDLRLSEHPQVPPRENSTTAAKVMVHFGLALINIGYVEKEAKEEIEFNYWGHFKWNDYRLKWDPAAYGNISTIRFPGDWLWKPDLAVFNALHDDGMFVLEPSDRKPKPFAVVDNTGEVLFIPPVSSRVRCPFSRISGDTFRCHMRFGSWVYNGNMIDFDLYEGKSHVDLTDFNDSKWKVTNTSITHVNKHYACCKEPYPYMQVNITMKARHRDEVVHAPTSAPTTLT